MAPKVQKGRPPAEIAAVNEEGKSCLETREDQTRRPRYQGKTETYFLPSPRFPLRASRITGEEAGAEPQEEREAGMG